MDGINFEWQERKNIGVTDRRFKPLGYSASSKEITSAKYVPAFLGIGKMDRVIQAEILGRRLYKQGVSGLKRRVVDHLDVLGLSVGRRRSSSSPSDSSAAAFLRRLSAVLIFAIRSAATASSSVLSHVSTVLATLEKSRACSARTRNLQGEGAECVQARYLSPHTWRRL